ncbi:MAG: S41 family peptidase, partial [Pseudomonadales bacterium]|nr:S41 family peptidase [Pseudomonadales bacterium]
KRFRNRLSRTQKTNSEDVYQLYMNSYTRTYDPHTQYFSPRTSENFNINMSLSLEGIGAALQLEDEYTKVISLIPAGPADKTGQLKPNDRIVGVGQGEAGEMVDVIGWRLDEVVQLIRGKKGTIVRLDVIPAANPDDSASRIISITRNKVELEEQSAQSEVIELEQFGHVHKIGVIDIPTFYVDFKALQIGDRNFKSTTRDVKRLLRELIAEKVDGVVIDLRDNGGGSLQEAKMLTGLFIDRGPTVQIRSKSNRVDILDDRDISVIYDGPLAVLVNRLSASASEIFAGAIQDYERGIIIGSQTFGKGTVQSLLPLNRGQLKLTQAKFYRISGESTQERGIIPDIIYPANYDPNSIG